LRDNIPIRFAEPKQDDPMRHLPAFFDIAGKVCVVVGGGEVAARKVALLERAGGRVRVISPELVPSLSHGVAAGRTQHIGSTFSPDHLDGATLAIAATDDRAVNARVSWEARRRNIPVNVVDDPALCSFQVPAIVDRDPVLIAVSTGGASPILARWVRGRIERALPTSLSSLGNLAQRWRKTVRDRLPSLPSRKRFWEELFDGPAAQFALEGRDADADRALSDLLDASGPVPGAIHLVGAGPGDPDLLTLRAHRLLQGADVIVYDRLVSDGVLDLARRDAETIYVGKAPGAHAMAQEDINALLVRLGREGKQVVRLKGGDPFVFGRGGEEMLAVRAAGLACHVVPGITATAGIGAAAGIPLTHRGLARNCTFITGHTPDGEPDADWAALARGDNTIVVYMGLTALPAIARNLAAHGLPGSTPAVVVENGTTANQRTISGTLSSIAAQVRASNVKGPALTYIGGVAALATADSRFADPLELAVAG
jgi:uroporphyrin-III C-methyltransferase/precorrin-2 dehydrogenase/sirohydrochlorin ferrochelatase